MITELNLSGMVRKQLPIWDTNLFSPTTFLVAPSPKIYDHNSISYDKTKPRREGANCY